MAKTATVVAAIGGVVVVGTAVIFYVSTRNKGLAMPPNNYAPPPPPPSGIGGDAAVLLYAGGKALSSLGHSEVVKDITGGEKASTYIPKVLLTGGAYVPAKAGYSLLKKLF